MHRQCWLTSKWHSLARQHTHTHIYSLAHAPVNQSFQRDIHSRKQPHAIDDRIQSIRIWCISHFPFGRFGFVIFFPASQAEHQKANKRRGNARIHVNAKSFQTINIDDGQLPVAVSSVHCEWQSKSVWAPITKLTAAARSNEQMNFNNRI